MIARRDLLKLAAAAGSASAGSFAFNAADAEALLAQPATFDPRPLPGDVHDPDVSDPLAFAGALDGADWEARHWFADAAAAELAAFKHALNAVIDLSPALLNPNEGDIAYPVTRLDQAALDLFSYAWMAGVRAGVAYEHLRLALGGPRHVCRRCHGEGRLWGGSPFRHYADGANETACPACAGRGTIATPKPTL